MAYYYPCVPTPWMQAGTGLCSFRLKVEGKGRANAQPDMAIVVLGVVSENKQLRAAQEENADVVAAVLRTLGEMGISSQDIMTLSYTVYPRYDYVEGQQVFRGYRVEHMLEVTIRDVDTIGAVVDAAVQSGANQVSSIKFSVSDSSAFYQQALDAAVDDAFGKVRTLGEKIKIAVLQVPVQIIEMGSEPAISLPLAYQAATVATPVQAGTVEITARIEAIFAYMPVP